MTSETQDIVFETQRLVIRKAVFQDAALYLRLWTNPEVMTHVGFPLGYPITYRELEDQIRNQGTSPFDRLLVVELKTTGEAIGECKLKTPNEQGIAETDVKLLPGYWGHKYGMGIIQGLLEYLFTHTDCVAVQATHNVKNIPSVKMQEAGGGVRVAEAIYEFPQEMRDYTHPVHHDIYLFPRENWASAQKDQR